MKKHAQEYDPTKRLTTLNYLTYGGLAGIMALTLMNPIWVLKTRLCLQYESLYQTSNSRNLSPSTTPSLSKLTGQPNAKLWKSLLDLWRREGIAGFYRGYVAGLLGTTHGAVQYMLYEQMRNSYNLNYRQENINKRLNTLEYLTFSAGSKLIAATVTYPYQVLRSRLQDQHRQYSGIVEVIQVLWRGEGIVGFYKGLVPNLCRVVPACAITFLVYERTLEFLTEKN